ncbi:hypothetical protein [Nesterenkonia flava]|uniref:Peptidoglycan-binding protein n=1 Tax=Nesterenkonia flava TaxID=469799 RepID=A0ABU1FX48_9MICC|nr:hypothetical protein [Nesterenkonia flava]MDR5712736.1 hypothetical protein [Nesterenkonia flava]
MIGRRTAQQATSGVPDLPWSEEPRTEPFDDVEMVDDLDTTVPDHVRPPRANRTIVIVAVTAILSLLAGIGLSQLVISPAQRAAETEPPGPGLITVPVEERELATDLTLRGDALYDDPVAVSLDGSSETGAPAVVTGQVPEVGDEIHPGDVLIEITGRPVIVLEGELPAYRSLKVGSSGPDVTQLRSALLDLGYAAGHTASDQFDYDLSTAIDALYTSAGYSSPAPEEGAREALKVARDGLRAAQQELTLAQSELTRASNGAGQDEEDGWTPDLSFETASRDSAAVAVDEAQRAVDQAWLETITPLPVAEILYVDSLPRRVDSVFVARGDTVAGEALTISGAELQILTSVSSADAELLEEGMDALLSVGDEEITAVVEEIRTPSRRSGADDGGEGTDGPGSGGAARSDRREVVLLPGDISEEQRAALVGSNVRVSIPMESTGGAVLAVPVAAITAGPGGESRVEVARGKPGQDQETELITVETGLTAEGFVEVRGDGLSAGDLVVVGR